MSAAHGESVRSFVASFSDQSEKGFDSQKSVAASAAQRRIHTQTMERIRRIFIGKSAIIDAARPCLLRIALVRCAFVASGNNSVVECDLAKVEVAGSNPVSRSSLRSRCRASFG